MRRRKSADMTTIGDGHQLTGSTSSLSLGEVSDGVSSPFGLSENGLAAAAAGDLLQAKKSVDVRIAFLFAVLIWCHSAAFHSAAFP